MNIPFLEYGHWQFPSPNPSENDGLVCVSRDMASERLLSAYRSGIFPWYEHRGYIYWFCVEPRAVLLPQNLRISRSLNKLLRQSRYRVYVNTHFEQVMQACASVPRKGQDGTWITPTFQRAYTLLHQQGYAHSFECYEADSNGQETLIGGFYGVQIGRVFYGESMFSHRPNASKIAFARAVPYLAQCGIALIDCQQDTAHLRSLGSQTLKLADFQAALNVLTKQKLAENIKIGEI